jgi:acyl carrier protein
MAQLAERARETPTLRAASRGRALLMELRNTIAEVLDVSCEMIADRDYLADELDADSLMDVALVVEDAYGIRFAERELLRMTCLDDIAECLDDRQELVA